MNRRTFIKTVGMASIASLIPFNLNADDTNEIEEIKLDDINNFNYIILTTTKKSNGLIDSFTTYSNKNTEKKLKEYYTGSKNVWFLQDKKDIKDFIKNETDVEFYYDYFVFGYNGNAKKIKIPVYLNDRFLLNNIKFDVCGISNTVEEIEVLDYKKVTKYSCYPSIFYNHGRMNFGLTLDEINKTNIKSIILPKKMYEYAKEYIPFVENNTSIKFSTN